jgi:hypothetical protein
MHDRVLNFSPMRTLLDARINPGVQEVRTMFLAILDLENSTYFLSKRSTWITSEILKTSKYPSDPLGSRQSNVWQMDQIKVVVQKRQQAEVSKFQVIAG